MKKRLILALSLALSANCLRAQTLIRSEIIGRPTQSSITVNAFYAETVEAVVEYGTASGQYTGQTPVQTFTQGNATEILVGGLQSNTRYFFRLKSRIPGAQAYVDRPERTFHTQRPAGTEFRFIVQADPHLDAQSDTSVYSLCLKNQLEDSADFLIDLGDFLMTDKLKKAGTNVVPHDTIPFRCNLQRKYYEKACHSLPLFNVLGNHEGEAGWLNNGTAENMAVWDAVERKKYFLNPSPDGFYTGDTSTTPFVGKRESYFAWHWGDALFIVIDPYWHTKPKPDSLNGWRWTLGKNQYDWLKQTLETSNASFKFIFSHQIVGGTAEGRGGVEVANLYEWGGNNLDGTPGFASKRPGWYKPIKDLLKEHRVNIFFHGHDHFFGKQEKDCLFYQECPQPSHPNFSSVNYADDYGYFEGQIQPNSGHIRVDVSPEGVKVDYVRVYLPASETGTRHNKDVSATYFIGAQNCYDSTATEVPILWNSDYADDLIFPNPANGQQDIKIEFSLAGSERMGISILDMQGHTIRKLMENSIVPAGRFQIFWDGKDHDGRTAAHGTYLYRIEGEKSGSRSGRIVLEN